MRDTLRPIALDRSLVAQARSSIRQTSIAQIMYDQIKRNYADDRARALRLDNLAGVGVEQVFRRKSGVSLSEPLPSLYGTAGFQGDHRTGPGRAAQAARARTAGCGARTSCRTANPAKIVAAVTNLYELDYIRAWDALLNDLEFVSFSTVSQTSEALRILTGTDLAAARPPAGRRRQHRSHRGPQGRTSPVRSRQRRRSLR